MPYTNQTQTNLTTLAEALKTQYLPVLNEQINNATVLFSRLEKDYDSVVGKNFTVALHTGRNESVAARAEGATLPTPGAQAYKTCIVPMRYLYGTIEITGQAIKSAKVSEGAYVKAIDSEMKGLFRDIKTSLNRQVWGDGTGNLTNCGSTSNSTTVTVDSTAKLRVGMRIDILLIADGTTSTYGVTDRYVDSITDATSFVISGAGVTTTSSYAIYRQGSYGAECMGLSGIFSNTSTLQGLTVAANPYWKANVLANGGTKRDISETLMQTAMDTTETQSDFEVSAIYTSYGVRRAYQALLQQKKQYVNPLTLKGGWTALDYNGKPLIVDKDAPQYKIFFACEDCMKFYRLSDLEWMQEDGAILSRVSGKDAYGGVAFLFHELGITCRNSQTLLADINEA